MAIAKVKVGDTVQVIQGRDRGKVGEVLALSDHRVKVSGVSLVKKHVKPNPQIDEKGGIKTYETFVDLSNVCVYDMSTQKRMKVGVREEDGRRVRYDKRSGNVIDQPKTN